MAKQLLFCSNDIAARVAELGRELTAFYRQKPLTAVVVMTGGICFAADLLRRMELPLWVDRVAVSSYRGKSSSGELAFEAEPKLPFVNRHVLLIDEIIDSGITLKRLRNYFLSGGAASVGCCVLLDKSAARKPDGLPKADWAGFCIPDVFVVGYGMDCDEEFRNSPDILEITD